MGQWVGRDEEQLYSINGPINKCISYEYYGDRIIVVYAFIQSIKTVDRVGKVQCVQYCYCIVIHYREEILLVLI